MWKGTHLSDLAKWCGGSVVGASHDPDVTRLCTDSRQVQPGDCFVALKGDKHDGHVFLSEVVQKGATSLLVSSAPTRGLAVPALVVGDTLEALIQIGAALRKNFKGPVFAITGSAGKSSTKDALATLLGENVVASPASFNNLLGVSRTLALVSDTTEKLVLEMGMNALGEIKALCETFCPQYGLITNIGDAHVGKLGGVEGIYRAKKEMFDYLAAPGSGVKGIALNQDDPRVVAAYQAAFGRSLPPTKTYSLHGDSKSDVFATHVSVDAESGFLSLGISAEGMQGQWKLPLFGLHHAQNIVAAVALGRVGGVSAKTLFERVAKVRPAPHRGEIFQLSGERFLIDESYNSNPTALWSSLSTLIQLSPKRRRLLVVGEMRELEAYTETLHREVGEKIANEFGAAQTPFMIFGVGEATKFLLEPIRKQLPHIPWFHVPNHKEAWAKLQLLLKAGDIVFVKGSRGIELDHIVKALRANQTPAGS